MRVAARRERLARAPFAPRSSRQSRVLDTNTGRAHLADAPLQPADLTDLQGLAGNRACVQLLQQRTMTAQRRAGDQGVKNQFYGHGAFMGAAPTMLKDGKWLQILQTLMPDVFDAILPISDPGKLMTMMENNPVMAAYGMLETLKLDQSNAGGRSDRVAKVEAMEWDVWLDPFLMKAIESPSVAAAGDDPTAAKHEAEEADRQLDRLMVDTMLISHGTESQTVLGRVTSQYESVKATGKTGFGGARGSAWMDLFGRALDLGTASDEVLKRKLDWMTGEERHLDKGDQSSYATFKDEMPFPEVVKSYKEIFGKPTFSVLLDVKTADASPMVLTRLVRELNRRGVHVYGIGSFKPEQLAPAGGRDQNVGGQMLGAPRSVLFFHGIGELQRACLGQKIEAGQTVMFNAGTILDSVGWKARRPDAYNEAIAGIIRGLGALKRDHKFHLGLYVQEGWTGRRAAEKITELTNANPDVFDLGFAWGGLADDPGELSHGHTGQGGQYFLSKNWKPEDPAR